MLVCGVTWLAFAARDHLNKVKFRSIFCDMSSELTKVHYADVLRSRNLAAQAKLVFHFGLARDNV